MLTGFLALAPSGLNAAALETRGFREFAAALLSAATPERTTSVLGSAFDGSAAETGSPGIETYSYERLRQAKSLLSFGTRQMDGTWITPFVFHPAGAVSYTAPSAGLEGFVFSEARLSSVHGVKALRRHVDDYANYLEALLQPIPWANGSLDTVREIRSQKIADSVKYERLTAFARQLNEELRRQVSSQDRSRWIRQARIYEIFPRAYNLPGKREALGRPPGRGGAFFADFGPLDLLDIKAQGFDTLWMMGIFPIGKRNAFGTAGGSPYSVMDHEGIHPELGTPEDFAAFVERAHRARLKVIIDFIPNHTSMDSKLLLSRTEYFLNRLPDSSREESPDRGFFTLRDSTSGRIIWIRHGGYDSYGRLEFWEDTAQVDYSKEAPRREMIRIVRSWVDRFGVDGFRVDMAYQVLNAKFARNWGLVMPQREFLEELITTVKAAYPATAFIAEAYDSWDELSWCGFDLIYGKNDMARSGGHQGWYDALASRSAPWIREALRRAEFLQWQQGGSERMDFIGNHDEAAPLRAFGPWTKAASFLTLLMPSSLLFYGSQEIGFDRPVPQEPKSIPFSVPVSVDWKNADPETARFYQETFLKARRLRERIPSARLAALPAQGFAEWVGYALIREGSSRAGAIVLANPSSNSVDVVVREAALGLDWKGSLPGYGFALIESSAADE